MAPPRPAILLLVLLANILNIVASWAVLCVVVLASERRNSRKRKRDSGLITQAALVAVPHAAQLAAAAAAAAAAEQAINDSGWWARGRSCEFYEIQVLQTYSEEYFRQHYRMRRYGHPRGDRPSAPRGKCVGAAACRSLATWLASIDCA